MSLSEVGRPRTCDCGECKRCHHREYMRAWYQKKTLEERRKWIARRDPERVKANDRARHERDKDQRNAAKRAWSATERGRELARKTKTAWTTRNPEKRAAQWAVGNAIRDGRLERGPCEQAGSDCKGGIHAHHDDYSQPLEVRWLCQHHHIVHHKELRAA